jgi:hypothetical protein
MRENQPAAGIPIFIDSAGVPLSMSRRSLRDVRPGPGSQLTGRNLLKEDAV